MLVVTLTLCDWLSHIAFHSFWLRYAGSHIRSFGVLLNTLELLIRIIKRVFSDKMLDTFLLAPYGCYEGLMSGGCCGDTRARTV